MEMGIDFNFTRCDMSRDKFKKLMKKLASGLF